MATVIMAIGGAAAPARAQDGAQNGTTERLLACGVMTDPTEKLACFNAVVESLKQNPAAPSANSPSASVPSSVSSPAARTTTTAPGAPPPVAPVASTVTPATVVDDFGRDSIMAKTAKKKDKEEKKDVEPIQATIVHSWKIIGGRFAVRLDNGQVWRETEGTKVGFPKEGRTVKISKGRLGGYRMKIEQITRVAWVRRTK